MKRILNPANIGLVLLLSAFLVGCDRLNPIPHQASPTATSTPIPTPTEKLTAFETVMARKEVIRFMEASKNDLMIWSATKLDGTVQVQFHNVYEVGTTPLWNYYVLDEDNQMIDAWIVFDDDGHAVCYQSTDPDTCSVELLKNEN